MDNYLAPEIPGYAQSILKSTFGANAEVQSFRWSDGGGLYNKVYCIDTSEGSFILKIECGRIFPSTRKGQIENEVEGSRLFAKAGIPCPPVIAHDFTGQEIGVRYILTECLSDDWPVMARFDGMDDAGKAEVTRQALEIYARMSAITNTHFGSLLPDGPLGRQRTWDKCYRAWFDLLVNDSVRIGLFTDEELAIVKAAAAKPLVYSNTYTPTFEHGDLGPHNMIWGHVTGGENALYVYDFGNSSYGLPHLDEYMVRRGGLFGFPPCDVVEERNLDKHLYDNLLHDFEGMLWKEAEKLTEDYAHMRPWMIANIEASKKDTSRGHVTAFAEKCKAIL